MDKKLVGLMLIFMLIFGLFVTVTIFNKPLTQFTKAKEEFLPSVDNSLIFAWPLTTKSEGKSNVQVNIFVRSSTNIPLPNKKVVLITTLGVVTPNSVTTDKGGKATFSIESNNPGIAELSAIVDDQYQLVQKVTVKFE
jgi:hypothetical protein